jgi:hypothetical protein
MSFGKLLRSSQNPYLYIIPYLNPALIENMQNFRGGFGFFNLQRKFWFNIQSFLCTWLEKVADEYRY